MHHLSAINFFNTEFNFNLSKFQGVSLQLPYLFRFLGEIMEAEKDYAKGVHSFAQAAFVINKYAIAVFDIAFSEISFFFSIEEAGSIGLYAGILEGGCRLIDICRGLYLLQSDPNVDSDEVLENTLLHILNIQRISWMCLNVFNQPSVQQVALMGSLADSLLRLYFLFLHRTGRISQAIHFVRSLDFDYIGRATLQVISCIKFSIIGIKLFNWAVSDRKLVKLIPATGILTGSLVALIKIGTQEILDYLGVPNSNTRELAEWSFALISSCSLAAATTLGVGLAQSKSDILTVSYLALGIIVASSLTLTFKLALSKILDRSGFQKSIGREAIERLFALSSATFLTAATAAGTGFTQSLSHSAQISFCSYIALVGSLHLLASMLLGGSLIQEGPMNWDELLGSLVLP